MIFCAGLGTRLQPLTNNNPKALVEYKGVPLLELVIRKLIGENINQVIVNVHHFAEQIEEFLKAKNNFGIEISISDERNLLLDTGGGLLKAKNFFCDNEPFLLYNVDILSEIDLKKFYKCHLENNSLATLAVKERNTSRALIFDETGALCYWQNNKTGEKKLSRQPKGEILKFAFSGIHIVNPEIFDYIDEKGVFSIIDLYLRLAKNHKISYYQDDSFWIDMGKKENFELDFNL